MSSAKVRNLEDRIAALEAEVERSRGKARGLGQRLDYANRRIAGIRRGLRGVLGEDEFAHIDRTWSEVERQIAEAEELAANDEYFGRVD